MTGTGCGGGWRWHPGLWESPTLPKQDSPHEALALEIQPFRWNKHARLYSHLHVPGLAPGVEISPASGILVRHQGSGQATQHGNHVVVDGARCIVGLQEVWAVVHTGNNSAQSDSDMPARAPPSCGQCGLDVA